MLNVLIASVAIYKYIKGEFWRYLQNCHYEYYNKIKWNKDLIIRNHKLYCSNISNGYVVVSGILEQLLLNYLFLQYLLCDANFQHTHACTYILRLLIDAEVTI